MGTVGGSDRAALTKASRHDAALTGTLIRGDNRAAFGDKEYVSDKRKHAARTDRVLWKLRDNSIASI